MKWLPSKARKQKLQGKSSVVPSIFNSTSQITILTICLVGTGVFLSGDSKLKPATFASVSPQKLSTKISDVASEITVKVLDKDFLGSGFIVQQKDREYIVITNQHVLRAGEAPYSVQTSDGHIYSAQIVSDLTATDYEYDIAILKFQADAVYPTAKIGSSVFLEVGEPIFAAGFPNTELDKTLTPAISEQSQVSKSSGFDLELGRIAIILNQALEEGYQIAYTNNVKKGMSGGPLLNSRGEVIGVNGKHAYPLWESPEIYQDGSQPCPALQKLITRSSLAIPIEKSIELTPRLKSVKPLSDRGFIRQSIFAEPGLVAKMQAQARATTQSCENFIKKSIDDEATPSL